MPLVSDPAPGAPEPEDGLSVTPEEVSRGRFTLTDENRPIVVGALWAAQDEVEAYLGQPVPARQFTETATAYDGYRYTGLSRTPDKVLSSTDNGDGTWTVVYEYGRSDDSAVRAVARYVKAAALVGLEDTGVMPRRVRSVSVEGQSVSYERASGGAAGSPPTLASLQRFRRLGALSSTRA